MRQPDRASATFPNEATRAATEVDALQDRARLIDASGNARTGELRCQHVTGGFTAEWLARFRAEPALIDEDEDGGVAIAGEGGGHVGRTTAGVPTG